MAHTVVAQRKRAPKRALCKLKIERSAEGAIAAIIVAANSCLVEKVLVRFGPSAFGGLGPRAPGSGPRLRVVAPLL